MDINNFNKKKNITKIILLLIVILIDFFLVYNYFIKNDANVLYTLPQEVDNKKIYSKFNIDILNDDFFKKLKGIDKIQETVFNKENVGRSNPFLKF